MICPGHRTYFTTNWGSSNAAGSLFRNGMHILSSPSIFLAHPTLYYLCILTYLGTGKSVLVRQLAQRLSAAGLDVAKTASTGIAAQQIGGYTLHRFTTVGDGSLPGKYYGNLLTQRPNRREKMRFCDVIIIDECMHDIQATPRQDQHRTADSKGE